MPSDGYGDRRRPGVARDLVAGLFLCAIAAAAFAGIVHLPIQDGAGVGPGLVPKSMAVLIAVLGVVIAGIGLLPDQERLAPFHLRGPLFVLGAVVLFAATIRSLGLAVAGPLSVMIAAFADRDSRPLEVVVFSLLLSGACVVLFKYVLRLPIPLAPFLLNY
ncbi:MAG: tripartite tricarboxylate transporter TctB family protein [Hyphomicrobiaceae bacterium]